MRSHGHIILQTAKANQERDGTGQDLLRRRRTPPSRLVQRQQGAPLIQVESQMGDEAYPVLGTLECNE